MTTIYHPNTHYELESVDYHAILEEARRKDVTTLSLLRKRLADRAREKVRPDVLTWFPPLMAFQGKSDGAISQTIPFTDLPAEVRNGIYTYALVGEQQISIYSYPEDANRYGLPSRLMRELSGDVLGLQRRVAQPPITRTSKQIRAETLPIFYGSNEFGGYFYGKDLFTAPTTLRWVDMIGTKNRELMIKPMELKCYICSNGTSSIDVVDEKGWKPWVVDSKVLGASGSVHCAAYIRFGDASEDEAGQEPEGLGQWKTRLRDEYLR